jgi:hypothetical protein
MSEAQRFIDETRFNDIPNDKDGYRIDLHAADEGLTPEWIIAATRDARVAAEETARRERLEHKPTPTEVKTHMIAGFGGHLRIMRDDMLTGAV